MQANIGLLLGNRWPGKTGILKAVNDGVFAPQRAEMAVANIAASARKIYQQGGAFGNMLMPRYSPQTAVERIGGITTELR